MGTTMARWSQSIFPKIIAMFLLILLPLYTASLLVNQRGENNVREEIAGSMQTRTAFFNRSLEREIERLMQLEPQYVNDKDLMDLSVSSAILDDFQISQAINALYGNLQLLASSTPYVKSVSVHLAKLGKTISTDGFVKPLEADKFAYLKLTRSEQSGPVIVWSDRMFVRSVYPDRVYAEGQDPLYILEVELSARALEEELGQILLPNDGAALLQGKGWSLSTSIVPGLAAPLGQALRKQRSSPSVETLRMNGADYLIARADSPLLGTTLAVAVPERDLFGPLQTYRTTFWVLLAISVGAAVVFALWIYRYIRRPLHHLMRAFRQMGTGNLDLKLLRRRKDEFYVLYEQFNAMLRRLKAAIDELYEQKLHIQRAELKQLQSNIHPHFLYNTFYIIYRMAQVEDLDSVRKLARHLGDYFRFMARNSGDEVPLALEADHARNYVEIQTFRFGNRIEASFGDLPPGCADLSVPKLIIQPLIENAFHHGLEHTARGGKLFIAFRLEAGGVTISVRDNGRAPGPEAMAAWQRRLEGSGPTDEVTGTVNVHRRLRLKYGPDSGVRIAVNEWGGIDATLRIPAADEEAWQDDASDRNRG